MVIDTTQQIVQIPIFSLSGVDSLLDKGLSDAFCSISDKIYNDFHSSVDLAAETITR